MSLTHLLAYAYALAIGLLLGGERERSNQGAREALGIRTFALLALIGTVAAELGTWVVLGALASVAVLLTVGYLFTNQEDAGTTTEVAAMATFLLGVLCHRDSALAALLAIVIAVVLVSKQPLHTFVRDAVSNVELEDALKFLVVAFVVLPLLPNRNLGPYGVLNLSKIWFIVVVLTGISWVGYIAVRVLGPRRGLLATGLASGFVSATAATASMGRVSRKAPDFAAAVAGAQVASVATFVQLGAILFVVSPTVALHMLWALGAGVATLLAISIPGYRRATRHDDQSAAATANEHPFVLFPALVLAVILTAATLVGRWGAAVFGSAGAVVAIGAAGLADAHGSSLSAATLFAHGNLALDPTLAAIGAAFSTNTIVKVVAAYATGGRRFATRFVVGMGPSLVVFLGVLVATRRIG
ncbi:MAG TPA: DUF4010 domain-containing protein [Acidimicrobiales bacterium]|nr:DUF4010 domain-containing protein [Acidimicrobiales bacterium]